MKPRLPSRPARLLPITFVIALAQLLVAQSKTPAANSDVDPNKLWTFTRNEQKAEQQVEQTEGPVVERKTFARVGLDGRYLPYLQVDKRVIQVNGMTVRTTERDYAIDPEGNKSLTQVVREEKQELGGGGKKIERTTSVSEANGRLRITRQETETSRQATAAVRESDTRVLAANPNGGAAAVSRIQSRTQQKDEHTVEFRASTLLPDGKGGWLVSEVREGTIRDEGGMHSEEERTSQPDRSGKLAAVSRVVTRESEIAPGEKQKIIETYSAENPGQGLELSRRVTTTSRPLSDGSQLVEEQVEERNPASPASGLELARKKTDLVIPGLGAPGKLGDETSFSGNRSVTIDMRSGGTPAVETDTVGAKPH
ncbi:MAG TPA: hypothetical protein VLV49_19090 [Terriglobales bacterium]|nr:hypothetical protein [Terriglobales bacterium]